MSKQDILPMLARKLIAALLCITIYPFIFYLFGISEYDDPNIFIYLMNSADGILVLFVLHAILLLLLGLPISIGIEFITTLFYRIPDMNTTLQHTLKHVTTLLLHLFFGLIFFFFSLISATTLFLIDLILQLTKKKFTFWHALISLVFPLAVALWAFLNSSP